MLSIHDFASQKFHITVSVFCLWLWRRVEWVASVNLPSGLQDSSIVLTQFESATWTLKSSFSINMQNHVNTKTMVLVHTGRDLYDIKSIHMGAIIPPLSVFYKWKDKKKKRELKGRHTSLREPRPSCMLFPALMKRRLNKSNAKAKAKAHLSYQKSSESSFIVQHSPCTSSTHTYVNLQQSPQERIENTQANLEPPTSNPQAWTLGRRTQWWMMCFQQEITSAYLVSMSHTAPSFIYLKKYQRHVRKISVSYPLNTKIQLPSMRGPSLWLLENWST